MMLPDSISHLSLRPRPASLSCRLSNKWRSTCPLSCSNLVLIPEFGYLLKLMMESLFFLIIVIIFYVVGAVIGILYKVRPT